MVPMYVSNMASWEDFSTTLGPVKGKALPLVGGSKIGDGREWQDKQQMEGYLAARMWIIVSASAARLPGLATMTCPSMAFQAKPQRNTPHKTGSDSARAHRPLLQTVLLLNADELIGASPSWKSTGDT